MTARILIIVIFLWLFFYDGFTDATQNDSHPVLTIEDGSVRGTRNQTVLQGMEYFAFRGIPFAKPPLGNLRFKDPIRNDKWNGTLDATSDKSQCLQDSQPPNPVGSEDCLYINVYTPTLNRTGLAVMVWVYGGIFADGNSSYYWYGPDYLLERDIIFVSFNYRLGILGFLSTEDLTCPGNIGMKDQVFALKWVRRNIGYFGGNSSQVTIAGQSAGAACVSYLTQSNSTKGLYSAAIFESGNSLGLWALNRRARKTAFGIGSSLGINTTDSSVLIQELRKQDAITLQLAAVQVSNQLTMENPLAGIMFSPVIEPEHKGAFFTKYSDQLLRGGFTRVPLLMGMTSNEGASSGTIPDLIKTYFSNEMNPHLAPVDLTNNSLKRSLAGNKIRYRYFKTSSLPSQSDAIVQFIGDDEFNRPIRRTVLDTMNYTKVFFYQFSYVGMLGLLGGVANRSYPGVGHTEELGYLFRRYYNSSKASPGDSLMRNRMVTMWTNFVKYHDPTPCEDPILQNVKWPLANSSVGNLVYLNIDSNLTIQQNPFKERMTFWDNIYKIFGDPPYDTF